MTTANFFKNSNKQLEEIFNEADEENSYIPNNDTKKFKKWKNDLITHLDGSYKIKINKVKLEDHDIEDLLVTIQYKKLSSHNKNIIKTILRDMYIKYSQVKKTKENIEILKLLEARTENVDFEAELAELITGDDEQFPYRSSYYLTKFFQNLGYDYEHNDVTRKVWVKEVLEELNIKEIHHLISKGLFKRKYFIEFAKEKNLDLNDFLENAIKEFELFIDNSLRANESLDLAMVLNLNINTELLFNSKVNTSDKDLNKLIDEARNRFLNPNDKQIALEKLWDAFERLKTYFTDLNKKQSASKIVELISDNFDEKFITTEFDRLTKIGNNYRIRHHEQGKKELTDIHIDYFFFRMLSLIDLCLQFLNED